MTCSKQLPFVCSVPMPEGYEPAEPKVEEAAPAPPAFEGKSVTCTLTIDNTLDSVKYNGETLSIEGGAPEHWNQDKTVTFTTTEDGGTLMVKGHDSEGGNSGHCKSAGFAIQCSSDDSFWGSFDSGSSNIKAAGGADVDGNSFNAFAAPCTTTSGFYLPANRNLKKLWAPNGERWAEFEMGPSVAAPPAFEGKSVTCTLTIDGGAPEHWTQDKTVTFTTTEDGGTLMVKGHD